MLCFTWSFRDICRRAREKQRRLADQTPEEREAKKRLYGYEQKPRCGMAWRIAGQYLRLLKVLRPQLQQQQPSRQLGSIQHPLLAQAHMAQQLSAAALRRNRGPAAPRAADDARAELQGLALW